MKSEVKIEGLSYSQSQVGSYVVVLSEVSGNRRLPVIIGLQEAESISLKLEGFEPPRPKTYDLIKSLLDNFNLFVINSDIISVSEGLFKCSITLSDGLDEVVLDSSISDAITLAFINNAPIFVREDILDSYGMVIDSNGLVVNSPEKEVKGPSIEDLNKSLEIAIENEDYNEAALIRDKILKLESWKKDENNK